MAHSLLTSSMNNMNSIPDIAALICPGPRMWSIRSKMEELPNEITHLILNDLPLSDLKNFRLISSDLTEAPVEHIFKTVRIILHKRSIRNIHSIARDPRLGRTVRNLSFDLRMVWGNAVQPYPCEWIQRCLRQGTNVCPNFEVGFRADYGSYVTYREAQHAVAHFDLERLCPYLKSLPNIRHLQLTGGSDHGASVPTAQDFVDFKTIWPRVGTVPYWEGNPFPERHIIWLLTAGFSSFKSLRFLSLTGLYWAFVKHVTVEQWALWCDGLRSVRNLELHLRVPDPDPGFLNFFDEAEAVVDRWAQFVSSPAALEKLDLALLIAPNRKFDGMPWTLCGYEEHLFQAVARRTSFMHRLRDLRFAEFVLSPNDFISLLLNNQARTLKTLKLHTIHLSEGSWLVFLRQLAHAADLEQFSLSGWISSEHEGWNALTQKEAAEYYGADVERKYPYERDEYDYNPDRLVDCEGFQDWQEEIEPLPDKWCIRALIEDWVVSGGGARGNVKTNTNDNTLKWAGWDIYTNQDPSTRPPNSFHDDGFPLLQGYLPACAVHHTPSTERQKQYRYESRWRTRLNRDFTFVWAEDLMESVDEGDRVWKPCPVGGDEGESKFCPAVPVEDDFVVPDKMVYEDMEDEFEVVGHFISQNVPDE